VDAAISQINDKLASASLGCDTTHKHAMVESLRHELNAFLFMKIAKDQKEEYEEKLRLIQEK